MLCGYSSELWNHRSEIAIEVETEDNQAEAEAFDKFRKQLILCYQKYVEILTDLAVTHIAMDQNNVPLGTFSQLLPLFLTLYYFCKKKKKTANIFSNDLELEELRGRRTLVIQRINKELSSKGREGQQSESEEEKEKRTRQEEKRQFLLNKKQMQLEKEEMLESEWERQQQELQGEGMSGDGGRGKRERQRYKIRLQNSFLDGVTVCGDHIIGCYAPNGWHAEKSIENALKCNVTFISVYREEPTTKDSTTKREKNERTVEKERENGGEESEKKERKWGPEIENAEVVFTDQGVSFLIFT